MSFILKYFNKSIIELEDILKKLVKKYEKITGRPIFIYCADFNKAKLPISMIPDDYFIIYDYLQNEGVM